MRFFLDRRLALFVIALSTLACHRMGPIVVPDMAYSDKPVLDQYSVVAPLKPIAQKKKGDPDRVFLSIDLGDPYRC